MSDHRLQQHCWLHPKPTEHAVLMQLVVSHITGRDVPCLQEKRQDGGAGWTNRQSYEKHLEMCWGILATLEINRIFTETDCSKVTNISKNSKYISA